VCKRFAAAKSLGFRQLSYSGPLAASVPWLMPALAETRALLGPDFWPYGLAAIRHTLQALLSALHQQELTAQPVAVEELLAPETWTGLDPEPEAARPN
jgi:4,5-dihydroxyphthalate decarboxylase